MGYRVLTNLERKYQPRKGLEGPFYYPNGQVLYYDPKAGQSGILLRTSTCLTVRSLN